MPSLSKILATTEPEQVSSTPQNFTTATFWGYKGFSANGIAIFNSGTIYLGMDSGHYPISVTAGDYFNWSLDSKVQGENLSNFWLRGQTGDGCYVVYYP